MKWHSVGFCLIFGERTIAFFTLLSLTLVAPLQAVHAADSDAVTKGELGGLVRDYLVKNPEVIVEAVAEYQKGMQQKGVEESKKAVSANKQAIYDNPFIPSVGDKNAKVAVVEFFDYNCSACKFAFKAIDAAMKGDHKDVRFIFMEYPIFGEQSVKIAKIGLSVYALAPEKYYDFHSHMMEHKGSVTVEEALAYGDKIGVKRADIEKEMSKPKYEEIHKANADLGDKLKISGTPFMIIGEEIVPHALDAAGLNDYIAKAKTVTK
jgi:protein-disulfide isomerase